MRQTSLSSRVLLVCCALAAAVACSAASNSGSGKQGGKGTGATGSGGDNGANSNTGGSLTLMPGGGASSGGSGDLGSSYPPPWQYTGGTVPAFKDPSLTGDPRAQFGDAETPNSALSISYPLAGSMHPNNLGEVTVQWLRDPAIALFRLEATAGAMTYHFYVPCLPAGSPAKPEQCQYTLPVSEWLDLGQRFAGQSLRLAVSGTDGSSKKVGVSASIEIQFSPSPVLGALYFWSTNTRTIKRAAFGSAKAVPYINPESATNKFQCAGCHTVSRNGKTIAFTATNQTGDGNIDGSSGIQVAPTDAPSMPLLAPIRGASPAGVSLPRTAGKDEAQSQFGVFSSINPDGTLLALNRYAFNEPPYASIVFEIRDTRSGQALETHGLNEPGALFGGKALPILPEWSPSGDSLAVTLADTGTSSCFWAFFTCNSAIATVPYSNGHLGAAKVLVNPAPGYYLYYPTWSPKADYIVFSASKAYPNATPTPPSSNDTNEGGLFLVPTTGGPYTCPGDCIELTQGMQQKFSDSPAKQWHVSFPKVAPFQQGPSQNLLFVTFTTSMPYGFLASNTSQLWMFAVDTSKVASGADPSFAPVWLPYQETTDRSVAPYWTETLPCQSDPAGGCSGCAAGEKCRISKDNSCSCESVVR